MRPHLLDPASEYDADAELPWNADALVQDLDLGPIVTAMAGGDDYLRTVANRVLLTGTGDLAVIRHRQAVLADALRRPDLMRSLYRFAADTLDGERKQHHFLIARGASALLARSVTSMEYLVGRLQALRSFAEHHRSEVSSAGLVTMMDTIVAELGDDYLDEVRGRLDVLGSRDGRLFSAELGAGNRGQRYRLHVPPRPNWWRRLLESFLPVPPHSVVIADRDEAGSRALAELLDRGLEPAAAALAAATEHVLAFFGQLRAELGFYLACVNLAERLRGLGVPMAMPQPEPIGSAVLSFDGLCEAALALRIGRAPTDNKLSADGARVVVVTGANQGGKSTYLRSLGQALLFLRAGMFVPARGLRSAVPMGVATHYSRGEDPTMTGGKMDDELRRMSGVADHLGAGWWLLSNEPFAATNAREGAEIGAGIVRALVDVGVRVLLVTHLFDLAQQIRVDLRATGPDRGDGLFLRAQRAADGTRSFRIVPGAPAPTSNAADLYRQVFGTDLTRSVLPPLPDGTPIATGIRR